MPLVLVLHIMSVCPKLLMMYFAHNRNVLTVKYIKIKIVKQWRNSFHVSKDFKKTFICYTMAVIFISLCNTNSWMTKFNNGAVSPPSETAEVGADLHVNW